jgi:hypothetical protein
MSINNNVFAESRFWQWFSGENRLNRVRRNRERLPSNGFIERAPQRYAHLCLLREGPPPIKR